MPSINAIIIHGDLANLGVVDEADLLVQSLTITPGREKQSWKGANLSIKALRYTNPTLEFKFNAIIGTAAGLANQHPGTAVLSLANFTGNIYSFDSARGVMVFEDASRSLSLESPGETEFTVTHYPFVGEEDDSWTEPV
jgi:hypothetical protein